jgi:hypothetical protein
VISAAAILDAARRAGAEWIEPALEPLAQSVWSDVAWRFSRLTPDGCPVEFGFSSDDASVRATLEVAGPEIAEHDRIEAACALLARLGQPAPEAAMISRWRALQAPVTLRWGCWLGLRRDDGVVQSKLYVELPRELPAPWPGARSKMQGYDLSTQACEHYAALIEPSEASLLGLLAPLGGPARGRLLEALTELAALPLPTLLNWVGLGASVGEGGRIALFLRARALRDGAARLRARFDAQPGYRRLFGARADATLPDHGVVSLLPHIDGTVALRCGVSAMACASPA